MPISNRITGGKRSQAQQDANARNITRYAASMSKITPAIIFPSCLQSAIKRKASAELICALVKEKPWLLTQINDRGENALQLLHRLHSHTVFSIGFRRRQVDCLFHDECRDNHEWKYVANVSLIIISAISGTKQLKSRRRASSFAITNKSKVLHAALQMDDCINIPMDIIRLLIYTPCTASAIDEQNESGNLPLHLALESMSRAMLQDFNEEHLTQYELLINDLLDVYPGSANIINKNGVYPIQIFIDTVGKLSLTSTGFYASFEALRCLFVKVTKPTILAGIILHYSSANQPKMVNMLLANITTLNILFPTIREMPQLVGQLYT